MPRFHSRSSVWRYAFLALLVVPPVSVRGQQRAETHLLKQMLSKAYPDVIEAIEDNEVLMKNGQRVVWDDAREKSEEERVTSPDLEDVFFHPYPQGTPVTPPQNDVNPGKGFVEAFFKSMYGQTALEVEENLETIIWLPNRSATPVRVTRINGVSEKLKAVSAELEMLPGELLKCCLRPSGSYAWKPKPGESALSASSFGITLELDSAYSNYWKRETHPTRGVLWKNKIPDEVVHIFEKHGFIWGGRWWQYDTKYFEFRPEMFIHSDSEGEDSRRKQLLKIVKK